MCRQDFKLRLMLWPMSVQHQLGQSMLLHTGHLRFTQLTTHLAHYFLDLDINLQMKLELKMITVGSYNPLPIGVMGKSNHFQKRIGLALGRITRGLEGNCLLPIGINETWHKCNMA